MSIITDIFRKRGIEDVTQLDKEERETFEKYEAILSKPDLTLADLKHFLESQIGIIETKWNDYDRKNKEDLIPYHTVYKTLLNIITAPQVERETLEDYLRQLHQL